MKSIQLQTLTLLNFKGIKSLEVNFQNHSTNIFGDNGTGKTTLFDAFTWLLFGKDSSDRKDFELKTLSIEGKPIEKIEHEVSATIIVDGEVISVKRVLREKWQKKRGFIEPEFTGNETLYYWNDVPVNLSEFNAKVGTVLNEQVFKMITNPLAFVGLKWQERRNVLMQMAGNISDDELAKGNAEYEALLAQLTQGKTLEDYKKQVAASVKKAKDEVKLIPSRIDEVQKGKPEAYDFVSLEKTLTDKKKELESIDSQIEDRSSAFDKTLDELNKKKLAANNLKSTIQTIEQNARTTAANQVKPDTTVTDGLKNQLKVIKGDLESAKNALNTLGSKRKSLSDSVNSLIQNMDSKRAEWNIVNAETLNFDENSFCCPTCQRSYEASDIESKKATMLSNFNNDKNRRLTQINQQGQNLNSEKLSIEEEIKTIDTRVENGKAIVLKLETEIGKLKDGIETADISNASDKSKSEDDIITEILLQDMNYHDLKEQLETLENSIEEAPAVNIEELKSQKDSIKTVIETITAQLTHKALIERANRRVEELNNEHRTLSQQIADVEKTQFTIESFNKLKIDTLEQRINGKFSFVKFKMFDTQINGGEVECCEPLINGVPFTDANTASKINAGVDIINTLSDFYGVTAPIFLDNRESVVKLIETPSQIVNLIVSETDKKLRVA